MSRFRSGLSGGWAGGIGARAATGLFSLTATGIVVTVFFIFVQAAVRATGDCAFVDRLLFFWLFND